MRDWIENHYLDRILSILSKELREVKSVIIDIASTDLTDNKDSSKDQEGKIGVSVKASESLLDHNSVGAPLDERLSFENFVVGPSNELAYAALEELQKEGMFLLILYFYMAVWVLVKLIYFMLWL